jgi:hypothetical protein
MPDTEERSAEDIAAIERASRAGEDDGEKNDYEPNSADTDDQKEAYDASWNKGYEKSK